MPAIERISTMALSVVALVLSASSAFAVPPPLINGDLLVADSENGNGTGEIIQVNPVTGAQTIWASGGYLEQPTGMAFDGKGNLIVSDFQFGFGKIFSINIATGTQTLVSSGNNLLGTTSANVETSGKYLVTNYDTQHIPTNSSVIRIDPATGNQTLLVSSFPQFGGAMAIPSSAVLDPNGNLLIADVPDTGGVDGIINVNAQTGSITTVSGGGIFNSIAPSKVFFSPAHPHDLLVTCQYFPTPSLSQLVDVDIDTGAQNTLAMGGLINYVSGVTEDGAGDIFLANQAEPTSNISSIIEISAKDGSMKTISTAGNLLTPQVMILIPEPVSLGMIAAFGIPLLSRRKRIR